jgi:non-heme chloroperoxidase
VGNRDGWQHGLRGEQQIEFFSLLRNINALLTEAIITRPSACTLADLPAATQRDVAALLAKAFAPVFGHTPLEYVMPQVARWPWLFSRVFPLSRIDDLRITLAAYLAGGHDYRDSLRGSRTPVTVFVGMKSPLYPAAGQMHIADLVQQGRVVRFEQSGHVPLINEPLKFAREFGHFLRET